MKDLGKKTELVADDAEFSILRAFEGIKLEGVTFCVIVSAPNEMVVSFRSIPGTPYYERLAKLIHTRMNTDLSSFLDSLKLLDK